MSRFQVLCVTMGQRDFSLYNKMKLNSEVIFANQTDCNVISQTTFGAYNAVMYSTNTRGVGLNRNIALTFADAEICLLADDDMVYDEGYEEKILKEFDQHPEADCIIFNIGTTTPEFGRIPTQIKKFKKLRYFSRNPFGGPRIAFRLSSVRKSGVAFSTYFGGGCMYLSGEDSIFITKLMDSGNSVYLSPVKIGDVSYENSSWFSKDFRKEYYSKGAMFEARSKKTALLYCLYYALFKKHGDLTRKEAYKVLKDGRKGYRNLVPYEEYLQKNNKTEKRNNG